MKYKLIPQYKLEDVSEITLLTVDEARKLSQYIRACGCWWWLRSPGYYQNYAAYVYYIGDVYEYGTNVNTDNGAVRPAFKISNLKSSNRKVLVENLWCTVVDTDLVIADMPICKHRFDANFNDWDKSELKAYINSDEFKRLIKEAGSDNNG